MNKRELYESIMRSVAVEVKKALNENDNFEAFYVYRENPAIGEDEEVGGPFNNEEDARQCMMDDVRDTIAEYWDDFAGKVEKELVNDPENLNDINYYPSEEDIANSAIGKYASRTSDFRHITFRVSEFGKAGTYTWTVTTEQH